MPILYNEQFEKLTTANEILPPQVGESGKVLQSDGLTANWSNLDTTTAITDGSILLSKLVPLEPNSLVGNSTGTTELLVPITLGTNLSFSDNVLNATLSPNSVTALELANNAVSNAKLTQAPALTLKGNAINATNNVGDITLGSGLSFVAGQLTATSQEFPLWTPNTAYLAGDSVKFFIDSQTVYLRRNSDGTSDSVMGTTEMNTWEYIGQKAYSNFPTGISIVPFGFKIFVNNTLWQSNQNRYTLPVFDVFEQAFWTQLTFPSSSANLTNLVGLRGDGSSAPVSDARLTYDASNASGISFLSNANGGFKLSTSATELQMNAISKTATGSALPTVIKGQDVVAGGLDTGGGKIQLSGGNCTGSAGSSIDFLMAPFGGTSGTTSNVAIQNFAMFSPNAVTGHFVSNLVNGIFAPNTGVTGNITVSGDGTGATNIGTLGTGKVNIGTTTKITTVNGILKQPNRAYIQMIANAATALPANTNIAILWNIAGANILGSGITLPTTTTIQIARTGYYRVVADISIQSATAGARGFVALNPLTAIITGGALLLKAVRLPTANSANEVSVVWEFFASTAGTFSILAQLTAAGTINANNGSTATAATTKLTIMEIG